MYQISHIVAEYYRVTWNNVQGNKFADWRVNANTGEWIQTKGTHTKRLPKEQLTNVINLSKG